MFKKIDNIMVEYDYSFVSVKTIVFLHGFGGNLSNFKNTAKVFQNYGFSTLNVNLTGYGFKNLNANFTIYNYANLIYKLIKSLKIKNCFLLGHSFGGRISIILASMYKNKDINFEKLILVDSAGLKPKFNLITKLKILKFKCYKFLAKKKIINSEKLKKMGSKDYKSLPNNLKFVFKNVVNENLKYLLKEISISTLIVWGNNDKETPLYMAKTLNKKIKNSTLTILKGGHYSYLDNSFKFFTQLKNFLNK